MAFSKISAAVGYGSQVNFKQLKVPGENNLLGLLGNLGERVAETAQNNDDYLLCLLGTSTNFQYRPTHEEVPDSASLSLGVSKAPLDAQRKKYVYGETLSYTAQLVAQQLGQLQDAYIPGNGPNPKPRADALSFRTPSVAVVDGPDAQGRVVGYRIAEGVFLLLKAIAEGKSNLQIVGHSRGAVEAILVAHELERIKKALIQSSDKRFYEILLDSPCAYTCEAIKVMFDPVAFDVDSEIKSNLLQFFREHDIKINMFLMDPVPGDVIGRWTWDDARFREELPCNSVELLIAQDERTGLFTPIIPKGVVPLMIPGHHGSASGNLFTQLGSDLPEALRHKDTMIPQCITLMKLLDFLSKNTALFPAGIEYEKVESLKHMTLGQLTIEFLSKSPQERQQLLFDAYNEISNFDKQAYEAFRDTSYVPFLARVFNRSDAAGARIAHTGDKGTVGLSQLAPVFNGKFVNTEHALLYLVFHHNFPMAKDRENISASIHKLTDFITSILDTYDHAKARQKEMQQFIDAPANQELSIRSERVICVFDKPDERQFTINAISSVVKNISTEFLDSEPSSEERMAIVEEITGLFETLTAMVIVQEETKSVAKELLEALRTGVKATVEAHSKNLIDRSDRLSERFDETRIEPEGLDQAFEFFIQNFNEVLNQGSSAAASEPHAYVVERFTRIPSEERSVERIETVFRECEAYLSEQGAPELLAKLHQESVTDRPKLMDYFIGRNTSLAKLEKLYQNLGGLIQNKDTLQELIGASLSLDIDLKALKLQQMNVLEVAAKTVIKHAVNLNTKPEGIGDEFFHKVKYQAIALGAVNPELEQIGALIELNSRLVKINEEEQASAKELADTAAQNLAEKVAFINQLIEPKESEAGVIIHKKLVPLADEYLIHLLQAAHKLNPDCNPDREYDQLPSISDDASDSKKKNYRLVSKKYAATKELRAALTDKENEVLPSVRIANFSTKLNEKNEILKTHRDSAWGRFFKNCAIWIGIIFSAGIATAFFKGKSSNTFFHDSHGKQFADKAEQDIPKPGK